MFLQAPFIYLKNFCAEQLGIYTYQNYIEILVFSFVVYKILRWLEQDHTKKLILHIYAYATLMAISYLFSCKILFWTMFLSSPILAIFCIIVHQKQLQKNFILTASKHITPYTIPNKNWLDLFIRSCLLTAYQNKHIFCIIERNEQLLPLLQSPYLLNLAIQQETVDLILSSNALHNPTNIWISHAGIIHSVNAVWKESLTHELLPINFSHKDQACAILLTQKTDALIFSIDPKTQLATLWHQGIMLQKMNIDQLTMSCKQILYKNLPDKQGVFHVSKNNSISTSSKLH